MSVRDYVAFGLTVRSAIEIPGAMIGPIGNRPDIEIAFGGGEIGPEHVREGPYRVGERGFEFAMAGVARYRCLGGERVLIEPEAQATEPDIAAMLIATVLPALLWARGDIVLHAAAAADPKRDRAVAVAGPSGSGKSTLLARAVGAGRRAIADDSLCLRRNADGVAVASGLPGGWHDPLTGTGPRRFNAVPAAAQLTACPLDRLAILTPGLLAPAALTGTDAFKALLDNRHRPRIARLMKREAVLLPELAAICASIPIVAVPLRSDITVSSGGDIFDIARNA